MLCQPGTSIRPHAEVCSIHRSTGTPYIRIMMCHPTFSIIKNFSSLTACNCQISHHIKERFMRLTQIGYFSRPIIHLRINVNRVFTIPGSIRTMIPDTLKIGRLTTGLRRRNQQITTILEHQSCHRHIIPFHKTLHTDRCLQSGNSGTFQSQGHTVILLAIKGDMTLQSLFVRNAGGFLQISSCTF